MLDFQLVQTPFRFGLQEGTDPHQLPPGTLMTAENCEWIKGARLQKRSGVAAVGAALGAGARLGVRGAELFAVTGTDLYAYAPSMAAWEHVDQVPDAAMTWRTTIDPYDGVSATDIAYSGGLVVHAWTTGDPLQFADQASLYVQVRDANGEFVMAPTLVGQTVHGVRIVVIGSIAHIVYRSGTNIKARPLDLTTFTFSAAAQNLKTNAISTCGFDAMALGAVLIASYEASTGTRLTVASFTYSAGAYTNTNTGGVTGEASTDFRCIALDGSEVVYVAYCDRTGGLTRIATCNASTMAQVTAPVTVDPGSSDLNVSVKRIDASGCMVAWSYATTGPARGGIKSEKYSSVLAPDSTTIRISTGARLISRIFSIGARLFVFAIDYPVSNATTYGGAHSCLMECETSNATSFTPGSPPHRFLGKLDHLVGGLSLQGFLCSGGSVSSTQAMVGVPFLGTAPQTTSNWRCGMRMATVTTGASLPADMWRSVTYGNETYFAGALLSAYDGRLVFDYGWPRSPFNGEATTASPTGGAVGAGSYIYAFHYEYRSGAGVLHRSATRTTSVPNCGATTTNTFTLVGTSFTNKEDVATSAQPANRGIIVTSRSNANGDHYYRWTFEPRYNTTTYDPTSASQTITDTSADSSIGGSGVALTTRPLLYTTGGILDDETPPNLPTMCLWKSRLFGVAGDLRTLWYSKSFQDDLGVAPGFSSAFRIVMEADIVALVPMDEKLVVFSAQGIWILLGDGPNAAGQNGDFQGPYPVQCDVGCSNPRSVVSTPDGVMFQTTRGLYLLTRALEVVFIGRPVQDETTSFPNITSAVIVPAKSQVRFTCNNAGASAHVVCVYHYGEKQWTTFRYLGGAVAIADAVLWNGTYTILTTAGNVYKESATSYLDAGSWVTMTLETAWISAAGPLAFQSVRRFALHGVSNSNHDLAVSVAFDGDTTTYAQGPATWLAGSTVTATGPLEAEVHIGNRRKCSSIRFKITDATPTNPGSYPVGTGQGPAFDTMGIEVGIKKGFQKKPAAKRA